VHHFKGSWGSCLNWLEPYIEPPKAFIELTPNLDLIIISMKDKNIFVPIEQEKEAKKSPSYYHKKLQCQRVLDLDRDKKAVQTQ
jgi:hypothetical protein